MRVKKNRTTIASPTKVRPSRKNGSHLLGNRWFSYIVPSHPRDIEVLYMMGILIPLVQDGATLQSVLNQLKKSGRIKGFAKCITDDTRKQAIDRGQWILTGALYGDWIYVRDHAEYRDRTDGKEAGHIFAIVGYNDIGWIALNSFGPNNGYFIIPYTYTSSLYSTYAIIDKDEKGELQAHKDKLLLEEAKRLGIWNGNNPKMNISREDVVLMLMRSRNVA